MGYQFMTVEQLVIRHLKLSWISCCYSMSPVFTRLALSGAQQLRGKCQYIHISNPCHQVPPNEAPESKSVRATYLS